MQLSNNKNKIDNVGKQHRQSHFICSTLSKQTIWEQINNGLIEFLDF